MFRFIDLKGTSLLAEPQSSSKYDGEEEILMPFHPVRRDWAALDSDR
jgi:hypothetical protein